jgi:glycosyltransferase involved in cell wall biosynthesis
MGAPPLRLLWLTETYPPGRGGMAQSCDRIVRDVRRAGVVVDVAHLDRRIPELAIEMRSRGADLLAPLDEDPAHALNRLWTIVERRHAEAPYTHVVAFGGQIPLLGAPVWAAWLGRPLVTLLRGNDFDLGIFSPRRADLLRAALHASACICTVTSEQARRVRALVPGIPVVFTPNGIDHADWRILPEDERRGREWRAAHVAPDRRLLGLFGQLKQKKGALFFLEALAGSGVADRFHLLVVGEVEPALAEWLRDRQATLAASVLPFRDRFDLLPFFSAVDLVAIPSFYDGMPNVMLEAAALGRPLLASDAGGMCDVLSAESALLFAAGDSASCRRVLLRAADAAVADLAAMAERARARTRAELDVSHETARYLRVFSELTISTDAGPGATVRRKESESA